MPTTTETKILRGGEWLLQPSSSDGVFTPERLTDEHRLIAQTAQEFVDNEVLPKLDQLEQKDWALARSLVKRGGDLGLLGVDVPEAYGGVGLDKVTSLVVSEKMARSASFGATFGAHANLTIVPIVLFGTEAQKQKYLPGLLSGEVLGAYGLSESGSGSDALGARTKATRQADGSFLLNGEKMWITNGGFADLFVIFAKVDGDQFTALLVERGWGVKSGKEEHKMGLHGSSTTALIFQDVKVPAENVLSEVGKGHKVAFNVLNFARFKLGAMCSGGAQGAIAESAKYAAARRQFGQPIASFGAIKHKIGEMVVRTYAIESLLYRTAGLVDARIEATPHEASDGSAALAAFEEYNVESSIAKVAGSEALNYVLDENIQIHGGNGYVRDYPAERHYRDARVNRIFEGTNEINRLLIPGMLLARSMKGEIPLQSEAMKAFESLMTPSFEELDDRDPFAAERALVANLKRAFLVVAGTGAQKFREKIKDEQEVLMAVADVAINVFAIESALLRAEKMLATQSEARKEAVKAAVKVFAFAATEKTASAARKAAYYIEEGDTLTMMLAGIRRYTKYDATGLLQAKRTLADAAIDAERYFF
jgi:alkylation response protein AidB-like acyl-CoA dehydrogenase